MANRKQTFRQRDISAMVKGVLKAGKSIKVVELDPVAGRLTIHVGDGNTDAANQKASDTWDTKIRRHIQLVKDC